jgi:hypothetical protein
MSTTGLKEYIRVGHKLHWCDLIGWALFYNKNFVKLPPGIDFVGFDTNV